MMTDKQIAELEAVAQENRDIVAAASASRSIDCSLSDIEKIMARHKISAAASRAAGAPEGVMQTVLEALDEVHHAFALLSLAVRGS